MANGYSANGCEASFLIFFFMFVLHSENLIHGMLSVSMYIRKAHVKNGHGTEFVY